ncbi:MAG: DUF4397 domain-containing protein [Balneolales bacterium]|nr:DUF4397 domain-containing protein [Balneolales bacterium]
MKSITTNPLEEHKFGFDRLKMLLLLLVCSAMVYLPAQTAFGQSQTFFHPETGEEVPGVRGSLTQQQVSEYLTAQAHANHAQLQDDDAFSLRTFVPGGTSRNAWIENGFAYFNDGPLMVIVDINDPQNPLKRGSIQFPGLVSEIEVHGDVAYVAARAPGGFHVVDVSDKDMPVEMASNTGRAGFAVTAFENTAFIGHGTQGFTRFDVTDPGNPVLVQYLTGSGSANGMHSDDSFLYVAFGATGFRIYDYTDPEESVLLSTVDVGGFANNVYITDDQLHVSWASGFSVYDVSDRSAPVFSGSYAPGGTISGFNVVDGLAYLSGPFGLRIVDVSQPATSIPLVGNLAVPTSLHTFSDGETAVVASRFFGLQVIDVTNPAAPVLNGLIDNLGFAYKVFIKEDLLYLMDIAGKVTIFDITDPDQPDLLSITIVTPNSENIYVKDNLVYVADSDGGVGKVTIIDVTDPVSPQILGTQSLGAQTYGVDVVDDRLYTASAFGGLFIFDRDDEGGLDQISSLPTGNLAYYVRQKGDLALLANFGGGLFIANISDESNPVAAGTLVTGQLVQSLDFREGEDIVVLADGNNGITSVSIANPSFPINLGSVSLANNGRDVRIDGNFLYAAAEFFGVRQFAAEDLADLSEIAAFSTVDRVTGLSVYNGLLAGAGAEGGLYIFDIPETSDDPVDPGFGVIQLIHNIADPAGALVDLYIDGELALQNVPYGFATNFYETPADITQSISIRVAGTDQVIMEGDFVFETDRVYSLSAVGVLDPDQFSENPDGKDISAAVLQKEDVLLESGDEDQVSLFVVHAATDAPAVDVRVSGANLLDGLEYGEASGYVTVPADAYVLDIFAAGKDNLVGSYQADLSTLGGSSITVVARGFLNPEENMDGPGFGLIAVLINGVVIPLELVPSSLDPIEAVNGFELAQNYPNPFNPVTNIQFSLAENADVKLEVFNLQGQRVATLAQGKFNQGAHTVSFSAEHLASGLYIYRLSAAFSRTTFTQSRKMMLVK